MHVRGPYGSEQDQGETGLRRRPGATPAVRGDAGSKSDANAILAGRDAPHRKAARLEIEGTSASLGV